MPLVVGEKTPWWGGRVSRGRGGGDRFEESLCLVDFEAEGFSVFGFDSCGLRTVLYFIDVGGWLVRPETRVVVQGEGEGDGEGSKALRVLTWRGVELSYVMSQHLAKFVARGAACCVARLRGYIKESALPASPAELRSGLPAGLGRDGCQTLLAFVVIFGLRVAGNGTALLVRGGFVPI